jgi:hypothetical protein
MTTMDEDKLLYPRSYINQIESLIEDVRALKASRPLHVESLDRLSPIGGDLVGTTLWIVDGQTGLLRGIITANPKPDTGNFYQAFFNTDGDITFGVDADDGSLFAALGDVILNDFGIYAVGGLIGGWALGEDVLESLTGSVGIVLDSSVPAILLGDIAAGHLVLDGSAERIYSSNFVSGAAGFNIDTDTGDAEFNNIIARGLIRTMVFEKGTLSSIGGQLTALDSDTLDADMTAADAAQLVISGSITLAVNDVVRMRGEGFDEWMKVSSIVGGGVYNVLRDRASSYAANANPLWKKGQAVVNYGAAGAGGVVLSSGDDPSIQIFEHSGSPWSDLLNIINIGPWGIQLANMVGSINFLDSTNTFDAGYIYMFADGNMAFQQNLVGPGFLFQLTMTDDSAPYFEWLEDVTTPNRTHFHIAHAAAGARFSIGEDLVFDMLNPAGTGTGIFYFNPRALDIDFVVNGVAQEGIRVDGATGVVTINGGPIKPMLTDLLTLYVRTDGNDANDGYSDSAGTALRNIQTAINRAIAWDNNGYDIIIQIGNGTYTENITLKSFVGSGRIILQGNISNAASVSLVTTGTTAVGGINAVNVTGTYIITWMKLKCTSGACIRLSGGATFVQCNDLQIDPSTYIFQVTDMATLNVIGDFRINAGTYGMCYVVLGGYLRATSILITFNGAVTMSSQFIQVGRTSQALINGHTFSGTFTGKRYDVYSNGVLEGTLGNVNYFPGTVAGTVASGGQYL